MRTVKLIHCSGLDIAEMAARTCTATTDKMSDTWMDCEAFLMRLVEQGTYVRVRTCQLHLQHQGCEPCAAPGAGKTPPYLPVGGVHEVGIEKDHGVKP